MKETKDEKLLRLWKERQEDRGYDVSGVRTLAEAEHFFDEKEKTPHPSASLTPSPQGEGKEMPKKNPPGPVGHPPLGKGGISEEEEREDELCDIDPIDEPV